MLHEVHIEKNASKQLVFMDVHPPQIWFQWCLTHLPMDG